ncbi:universal stress protein [Streptomyces nigrescens]|uniref:Universal stress protein n=2 Tax=Streptomyces TaxID=1883 RepID=A0ABM7ZRW4_STRNI|nr:universal stress protein [Streptomyces nigrescens]MEE4418523.1 universal stress protein [Streptomyces sp. DSM 41528]BDM69116.1 universal stress protein [Streptomyces nigrescens]
MQETITAGVDGTPESSAAVLWAAQEAELRRARLRLLHAWVLLAPESAGPPGGESDQNYWPHRMMDEVAGTVRARYPDLPLERELVPKDPLEALTDAAGRSDLLVLGTRDLGPVSRYVLGEVGLQLIARTTTPLVLVRTRQGAAVAGHGGDVVVGVGLHEPHEPQLTFAFDCALRHGVTLRVVHGRHLPSFAYNRGGGVEPYAAEEAAAVARQDLARALGPWREKYPDVAVDARVELESAAPALLRDTADAGLLVVGRRHRHLRPGPRIGHVVQAVVHHAACPVAVVPHEGKGG